MTTKSIILGIFDENKNKSIKGLLKGNSAEVVAWLEISYVRNLRTSIGISCNGFWAMNSHDGIMEFGDGDYVMPLLPCLKSSYSDFIKEVSDSVRSLKIKGDILGALPVEDIIDTGLLSIFNASSTYWLELSLNWISQIGCISERLRNRLLEISKAERGFLPQPIRHRSARLSKLEWKEFS